jgi:hypothetical protein
MNYPYFGFQMPGALPGQPMNPFMNAGSQYSGAMPATLGGVGASPISSISGAATPNMNTLLPMGMAGMSLMNAAHQQPGQQPSTMQQMMPGALGVAGLLAKNPNLLQGGGGLLGGLGGLLGSGAAAGG